MTRTHAIVIAALALIIAAALALVSLNHAPSYNPERAGINEGNQAVYTGDTDTIRELRSLNEAINRCRLDPECR